MIKKINIFLVLLLLFISIASVSAVDNNITELTGDETIPDTLDVSADENVSYNSQMEYDSTVSIEEYSHTITNSNYNQYFSSTTGKLVSSSVKEGDTINLDGSFSDKSFIFEVKVNIVGTSTNNMKNSMITLLSGASGSTVSNLNIANTKAETYGIFLNSASNCIIKGCTIKNTGKSSYCICIGNNANYNNVTNNDLKAYGITYGHGTRSTSPFLVSGSHYNYIANNVVEADDANGIYLSSFSGGPLNGGVSNFNIIYNNTVKCSDDILPTSWSYCIQIMGNNNTISSNTVYRGYRGISTSGSGNIITDNTIINITGADYNHLNVESGGEYAIVGAQSSIIRNNTIIGCKIIATGAGISGIDNSIIENNKVEVLEKGRGIVANGNDIIIKNNIISTQTGSGIYEKDEGAGLLVEGNNITSESGVGVLVEKLSSKRMPSDVTIINNYISTSNTYAIDISGVKKNTATIENNKINGEGLINSPNGVYDASKPTYNFKGKTITITPSNIRQYINVNGGLTAYVNDSDILNFEGEFSNEIIYVTKSVKITGNNPIFYNTTFKVTSGSVLIENLTIINSEAERVNAWGIFTNQANGVRIQNNKISVNDSKAAYAIYLLESTDIDVLNNELSSSGDYLTFTILSYACEDCNIANNTVKTIGTGEVYNFEVEKCLDGSELVINGKSYCLDGNEITIDGKTYCLDGNELTIDGTSYCLDGNELVINGETYCLDGNELTIGGTSYCLDGNELVINGTTYCMDGNEAGMANAHVVSEIYRTYGILLLYSSNNIISENTVNVTSKLGKQYPTTGNGSSENSLVGIDVYFNSHNNKLSQNTVYVSGNDNYLYGMGVLGYNTGHSAPEGQGASHNVFDGNNIYVEGPYFTTGLIIGWESYNTELNNNIINLKADSVAYGITLEMSQTTTLENNELNLNSEINYGVEVTSSSNNILKNNKIEAEGSYIYGILVSNGANNEISVNTINAKSTSSPLTTKNLDALGYGNAGVYLKDNSSDNILINNNITSAKNYSILIDNEAINNIISDNYLDSEKGIGNKAVNNSKNNNVSNNYKYIATPTISPINVVYLGNCEFKLIFDNTLNGAAVEFYDCDGVKFATSTVVNGVASAKYKFDSTYTPTNYIFTAKLTKENYKSSTYDLFFEIGKGNLSLSMSDVIILQGAKGNIVIKVLDNLGNPIKGAVVEYYRVNSAERLNPIGSATTNANGIATLTYTVPASLNTGVHDIVVKINGLDYYNDANATFNLKVAKKALITGGKSYSVYYGNTIKYKVRIFDLNGKAVGAGNIVTFTVNGQTKKVKTDKNGYATFSAKFKTGTYTITAQFNGYKVSNKLTFKPTLIAKNISKKKVKVTKFTVKLVNNKGKILKSKKITFKLGNKKYSAKTNKKGIATLSLKNLKIGKYAITSSYGGCTIKNTIQIKK